VDNRLDGTLAALSDPKRRAVVELLRHSPLCPSDIADRLSLSRPALSRHLRVLRKGGLVEERADENDARVRLYRLRRERFSELSAWIQQVEAFWSDQLQGFRAHAERRHTKKSR
jgi:DNA-binding transcriptional ArsR family regulator